MKHAMALAMAFALVVGVIAASAQQATTAGSTTTKKKAVAKTSTPVSVQLNEMKLAIDAQQRQIQQLTQQVQSRDSQIQQLQQQVGQVQSEAAAAQQKADAAASQTTQQQQDVASVKTDVTDLKQNATNTALSLQETQKNVKDAMESPLAIHYKGVTITPEASPQQKLCGVRTRSAPTSIHLSIQFRLMARCRVTCRNSLAPAVSRVFRC